MTVTLKPELEKLAAAEIEAGRASDLNDFLNRAIYHYALAQDLGETYTPEELDSLIAEGLSDIKRGDTIGGEAAFRHLRSLNAQRRQQTA
jgi:hypothetical protein